MNDKQKIQEAINLLKYEAENVIKSTDTPELCWWGDLRSSFKIADKAIIALDGLTDKAEFIAKLEKMRRSAPSVSDVIECDLTPEDFHEVEFYNQAIDTIIKELKGQSK